MTTALPRKMEPTRDKLEWGKTYQLELSFILEFIQNRSQRIVTMAFTFEKNIKRTFEWNFIYFFASTLFPMLPPQEEKPLNNRNIYNGNFCLTRMVTILWKLCIWCFVSSFSSVDVVIHIYTTCPGIYHCFPSILWCNCWWRPEAFEL